MSPIWLLDIDGVLNALDDPPDIRVWPADEWVRASALSAAGLEWELLAAAPVLHFLRTVHEQGRAEIWWHSAWQHHSVNAGAALGLPEWPVLECPEYNLDKAAIAVPLTTRVSRWWKLPAVHRLLAEGRPLLWTDDDARHQLRRADVAAWGDQTLVISPSAGAGLSRKHLSRIDRWLTTHRDSEFAGA